MKVIKFGDVSAVILGGMLLVGATAQAQEKKDAPAAPAIPAVPATPAVPAKPATPATKPDIRAARIDMRLNSMARSLSLTDEQKQKLKPILEDELKKLEELQQDKGTPAEQRMAKIREIREGTQAKLRPLLSAEQQQKMDNLRQRPARRPEAPPTNVPAPAPAPAPVAK